MTSKYGSDRNYVLPGDKTRTPVTHEQFLEYMRPLWRQRKALERAGFCNPPRNFICSVECSNCPYANHENMVSLTTLEQNGLEIEAPGDLVESVANVMFENQLREALPQLDVIDQIIIRVYVLHDMEATERECAEMISKAIGRGQSDLHHAHGLSRRCHCADRWHGGFRCQCHRHGRHQGVHESHQYDDDPQSLHHGYG